MSEARVGGRLLRLDPAMAIGVGGEAEIFDIGGGLALKLFKPPEHPDYQGQPEEQQAARERLDCYQQKLRAYPLPLPDRVVQPQEPALDRTGKRIVGYVMRLVRGGVPLARYGDRQFRQGGVPNAQVGDLFKDLHATLTAMHGAGVLIGDFNDQNALVLGAEAHLIDADSYQFGAFPCTVFTALCGSSALRRAGRRPDSGPPIHSRLRLVCVRRPADAVAALRRSLWWTVQAGEVRRRHSSGSASTAPADRLPSRCTLSQAGCSLHGVAR
jgi:hypothetical protein